MNKKIICLIVLTLSCFLSACDGGGKAPPPEKYFFAAEGVTFSVGDDADEVTARLGECNSSASAPSCAGEGFDEVYRYNGFRIFAHRDANGAKIAEIDLVSDLLPTAEGAFIGDSADRIKEIYGEGDGFSGGVEYRAEGCRLRFFITDGRVTGIKYLEGG
ncbi:MAG: hypothetical protein ACI3X1_06110 [Eubacteriales bacterium]